MFGLGSQELLVILVIVLVLFGAKRLPELARSLGSSLKEFKKGVDEAKAEDTTPATSKDDGGQIPPRAATRACSYCKTSLDVDWSHCPRCGTAVVQGQELPPRDRRALQRIHRFGLVRSPAGAEGLASGPNGSRRAACPSRGQLGAEQLPGPSRPDCPPPSDSDSYLSRGSACGNLPIRAARGRLEAIGTIGWRTVAAPRPNSAGTERRSI